MMLSPGSCILTGILCLFLNIGAAAQGNGCTDPAANNFSPTATVNDGSCTYNNVNLSPVLKANLAADLLENSGIVFWNSRLWTHNDGGSAPELIELDTTGTIIRKISVSNAVNNDWEDIAQDNDYFYIGDFGNNAAGNRQDLRIYRIPKPDVLAGNTVTADVINFSYEDQTSFAPVAGNTTDYDCEAMIVYGGRIYLFTKRWTSLGTSVYELPVTPGTWSAVRLNTNAAPSGLVTGADVMPDQRSIALCGYTSGGARFLYLLYDFSGNNFFSGNKRYVGLNGFGQTEGLAFRNSEYIYIARERLTVSIFTFTQALEAVNLTNLLKPYYTILPIQFMDLKVDAGNGNNRIKWTILPEDEFSKGWLQRRSKSEYKDIHFITEATGMYIDEELPDQFEHLYYRIRAIDKDARQTYSKEYRVKLKTLSGSSIKINGNNILIPVFRKGMLLEIIDITGARILETRSGQLDITSLKKGVYIARLKSGNNETIDHLRFVK